MKLPIKTNISYAAAGMTVLVIFFLTIFCQWVNFSLIIPLLLLLVGLHLFFIKRASVRLFLQLGLLLALLMEATYATVYQMGASPLYVPVASLVMLTMLLFNDLHLGFLMAVVSSILASLLISPQAAGLSQIDCLLIFLAGNLTAVYTIRDARTRGHLIGSGFYVGIMMVVAIILLHPEIPFFMSKENVLVFVRPLILNGVICSFFVLATLKIFEFLFGVLTNFSLLELSDFNQPLLKRMILEAPGTYQHSLVVGNVAEAAADAIGANSLLTRVGAYYHDIGKMEKPEYFTENQLIGGNKHDRMEPSMSRLVILNHVKEGLALAKKNKLNPMIADFIPQHHGTSLMHYFYQKALEDSEDEKGVKEENYRYPGPKPQRPETAIVLLADSVEAATRSLDEASPIKIEETVRKIINNKFIDGQLDECNLTLKEIELIASTFTRILGATYHGRVKYPEKKNESDNRNQKPAEDNPDSSRPDQNGRKKNPKA